MDRKLELLNKVTIFSQLNKTELETFASLCDFIDLKKDTILFKKADSSKSFFIVDSGKMRIVDTTAENEENVLAYFIPGEVFGEFDLFENDPRTATAIANEDTRILVFPKQRTQFDAVYKEYPDIIVKICHTLITVNAGRIRQTNKLVSEKTSWIEDMRNQMLMDKLTGFYNRSYLEDEFPTILARNDGVVTIVVVKPDDFKSVNDNFGHEAGDIALKTISNTVRSLLGENETPVRYRGNEFIVVYFHKGLEESLSKAEKMHKVLSDIDIGKLIGDKSLKLTYSMGIAVYPKHADNLNAVIDLAYAKLFEQRDNGGRGILHVDDGGEDTVNFLKSVAAFSTLYRSELREISKYLKPFHIKSGDIVCKEGDEGNEIFIIQSGKAVVTIRLQDNTEKEITEFSTGDFFGEMAIFENEKRSATCTAKEDSTVLKLYKEDFFTLMEKSPVIAIKIMREMLDITSSRISKTGKFVSDMVRWGEEASKRAITDELTGVYNRRYLDSSLEKSFAKAKQNKKSLSVIMADMDYFREVNEGYSHDIGDKYIVEVAKVFRECLRKTDIIARYGGDEFTILLPNTGVSKALKLAESIRASVEKLDFLEQFSGPEFNLSISQGVATFPKHCDNLKTLTELADKALYKAKEGGRNRVEIPDKSE